MRSRNKHGGAVLETACVLPVLFLVSFGLVEFAHFFYMKHILAGAAREGARTAILASESDPNGAITRAMTAAGLGSIPYTVTTTPADLESAAAGDEIEVQIDCTWSDVGLRPLHLISGDTIVRGSATMMKEGSL